MLNPKQATWTKDKPADDGYYWWRGSEARIVEVCDGCVKAFHATLGVVTYDLNEVGGEWLGPLVAPA